MGMFVTQSLLQNSVVARGTFFYSRTWAKIIV
jgi:hypothetical protein